MDGVILNAVSLMPSGSKRFSFMTTPSFFPLTASTALPTKSMLMPYSHRSPGSKRSGVRKAAFWQPVIPGTSWAC